MAWNYGIHCWPHKYHDICVLCVLNGRSYNDFTGKYRPLRQTKSTWNMHGDHLNGFQGIYESIDIHPTNGNTIGLLIVLKYYVIFPRSLRRDRKGSWFIQNIRVIEYVFSKQSLWQLSWYLSYDYELVCGNGTVVHGDKNDPCLNYMNLTWLRVLGHAIWNIKILSMRFEL